MKSRKKRNMIITLILAGVLATATFAFTATNVVPGTKAGDGSGAITGYTVSNIAYDDNGTDITEVDFTLSAAAGTAKASLDGTTLDACVNVSGNDWTCDVSGQGVTIAASDSLRVVAYS